MGEERRRVSIDRKEEATGKPLEESSSAKGIIKLHHSGDVEDIEPEEEKDDMLRETNAVNFVCKSSKVPLALYPAVLG